MSLPKEYTKLSPRILEHITQRWCGKLSQDPMWNKSDSKTCLLLTVILKDLYSDQYKQRKEKLCQK